MLEGSVGSTRTRSDNQVREFLTKISRVLAKEVTLTLSVTAFSESFDDLCRDADNNIARIALNYRKRFSCNELLVLVTVFFMIVKSCIENTPTDRIPNPITPYIIAQHTDELVGKKVNLRVKLLKMERNKQQNIPIALTQTCPSPKKSIFSYRLLLSSIFYRHLRKPQCIVVWHEN